LAATDIIKNLRFGDGELLKDGTGDYATGRTLKGRYIVRVGWDDVRGWFTEVGTYFMSFTPLINTGIIREVLSLEQLARKNFGPPKGGLRPLIILSKKALTRLSYVAETAR
jgi:6-phosphofructokinase 1